MSDVTFAQKILKEGNQFVSNSFCLKGLKVSEKKTTLVKSSCARGIKASCLGKKHVSGCSEKHFHRKFQIALPPRLEAPSILAALEFENHERKKNVFEITSEVCSQNLLKPFMREFSWRVQFLVLLQAFISFKPTTSFIISFQWF